ncbi:MAG: glycosyltransferase family 39 protein [Phycisphaerae bacterium]|nr:glycosyltransferase family 39 protein [Phycisphaerae bacterium]
MTKTNQAHTRPDGRSAPLDNRPSAPLEISRRFAVVGVAIFLVVAAVLLAKQIAWSKIATRDACGFYLPLANAFAVGHRDAAQHPMVPPLYPFSMGLLARAVGFADDPAELAGQIISAVSVLSLVVCVYFIASMTFSRRTGLAAGALVAVNRWIIRFGGNVGPAMMYSVFVTLVVLGVLRYKTKPSAWVAAFVGVVSAAAALTRSEGVFLAPLAAIVMLAVVLGGKRRQAARVVLHLAIMIVVVGLLWSPRLSYMRAKTGRYVLDVRTTQLLEGQTAKRNPSWWRPPNEAARIQLRTGRRARSYSDVLQEAGETLVMVIGPATWVLAGVWFFRRKNIPRRGAAQLIIAAVVITEIAIVARVKMDRRYVASVASVAQVWGGLGMVVLSERLRGMRGRLGAFGRSLTQQMVAMGFLIAALACWSVLSSNVGTRHQELRRLGRQIRDLAGAGQVVLGTSTEPAYYADGRSVLIVEPHSESAGLSPEQLGRICRANAVGFIVIRSDENWCSWLGDLAAGGEAAKGVVLGAGSSGKRARRTGRAIVSYLIDAEKLIKLLPDTGAPTRASVRGEAAP